MYSELLRFLYCVRKFDHITPSFLSPGLKSINVSFFTYVILLSVPSGPVLSSIYVISCILIQNFLLWPPWHSLKITYPFPVIALLNSVQPFLSTLVKFYNMLPLHVTNFLLFFFAQLLLVTLHLSYLCDCRCHWALFTSRELLDVCTNICVILYFNSVNVYVISIANVNVNISMMSMMYLSHVPIMWYVTLKIFLSVLFAYCYIVIYWLVL